MREGAAGAILDSAHHAESALAPMHVVHLGLVPYATALELQRAVARARISGAIAHDVLLLLEHPPVVTLGRSSKAKNLVASPALLAARGVEVFEAERGGDVTFHGPGQLVGYPIANLRRHKQDLHWYLRQVEEVQAMDAERHTHALQADGSPDVEDNPLDDELEDTAEDVQPETKEASRDEKEAPGEPVEEVSRESES